MPRIVKGRALLDKLPFWVAGPAGLAAGLVIGYRASVPEVGVKGMAWAVMALLAVVVLAKLAPKPARRRPWRALPDKAPAGAPAQARAGDGDDESLCG